MFLYRKSFKKVKLQWIERNSNNYYSIIQGDGNGGAVIYINGIGHRQKKNIAAGTGG